MCRHLGRSISGYESHNGNTPLHWELYSEFAGKTRKQYLRAPWRILFAFWRFILYRPGISKGIKMDEKKLSFEEAYKQLSDLVKKMESGELPLADSVAAYEQGIKLKAYCEQLLKEAELKIETLKVSTAE